MTDHNLSTLASPACATIIHPHTFTDIILRCEAFLVIPFFRRDVRSSETYDYGFLAKGLCIDTPYVREYLRKCFQVSRSSSLVLVLSGGIFLIFSLERVIL